MLDRNMWTLSFLESGLRQRCCSLLKDVVATEMRCKMAERVGFSHETCDPRYLTESAIGTLLPHLCLHPSRMPWSWCSL